MIHSMTAFARAETQTPWGQMAWELRSVNHRYLDVYLRLPEDFRRLENDVRQRIGARLARGKVEATLNFRPDPAAGGALQLNAPLLDALLEAARRVDERLARPAPVSAIDVLRWPGMVESAAPDLDALRETALALLDQALDELVETRRREGARLAALVEERLNALAPLVTKVRQRRPEVVEAARRRLLERLDSLRQELDPQRLEQEVALLAQRLDVEEELDRLAAHLDEVRRLLHQTAPKPVGRRLDFLMQELNREANTLASKSADVDTTRAAVDMKVLIEQMREQIQNIE